MRTFKQAALALTLPAMLASALPAGAAVASHGVAAPVASEQSWQNWRDRQNGYDRYDRGERYGQRRYYDEPVYSQSQVWRGNDGRYYCRHKDGTTGLIVGGAAGALIGRGVAGRGDHTLGAILGGLGGALLGREVDRSGSRCR
jgi:hypothetical protein